MQLPFSPRLREIEQRFNKELTNYIRNSLTTLLACWRKTVYPNIKESTLLTLLISVSTLRSLALPKAVIKKEREALQPKTQDYSKTKEICSISSNPKTLSDSSISIPSASLATRIGYLSIQLSNDIALLVILSTLSSSRGLLSNSTSLNNCVLLQGQIVSKSVKSQSRIASIYYRNFQGSGRILDKAKSDHTQQPVQAIFIIL